MARDHTADWWRNWDVRPDVLSAHEVSSLTPTLGSSSGGVVPPLPVSGHGQVGTGFEQGSVSAVHT